MYGSVLAVHSWLRWGALICGALATGDAAVPRRRPRASFDSLLMFAIDCQVLLGLLLYFGLSPLTRRVLADFGGSLGNPVLRFWGVIHVVLMFGAFVLVRVGRVLAMTAPTPQAARRRKAICFGLATLVMAAGTPWPGTIAGRPLLRL
jgi:hypothetical protein